MDRPTTAWISLLLGAGLAVASPSLALTDATSQGTAHCSALTFPTPAPIDFGPTTAEIVQLGCDRLGTQGAPPFVTTTQSVVILNTGHSAIPVADVQLSLSLLDGTGANSAFTFASGQAQINYEADIRLKQPTPFNGRIPILLFSRWSIDRTVGADASVRVQVSHLTPIGPEGGTRQRIRSFGDPTEQIGGTFVIGFGAVRGPAINIQIDSSCDTRRFSLRPGVSAIDCQAVIDPIIAFDQATFDATMGANSFVLADFFEIGLSTNLPEPGTAPLLALGLLGLASQGRRRR